MLRYKYYNNTVESYYKPKVTVFLPTYNEEDYIARKLDNLLSQSYPVEIVIYDCSTDKTREIIKDYQSRYHNITLIEQKERIGMALTMNEAIDNTDCDIFIKTDVDSITLSNDAIKNIIKHFADPKIGVVTGTRVNKMIEGQYNNLLTRLQIVESNIDSIVIGQSPSLLAFRKSAMEKVSSYSMAEDTEEVIAIRRKGYKAIIDTSIVSIEDIPQDFKTRRLQKDRRAEGIVRVLLKNKDMLFNKRYGKYGLIVLPMEFFLLVISPFLIFIIIIVTLYTVYSINVYAGLTTTLAFICIFLSKRTRAIIDAQISGMIATIKALLRKDNPLWKKVR
ncbi:MAG: glycosyltransferase [Candidatus Nitrosocaldaceae archaeon]